MQMTRGSLKKIIQEEIQKMVESEESSTATILARSVIAEFESLSESDKQVFLNHFVGFLNEKKA